MKTVRRPPYPKWNPGYFPCSSLIPLPLSSRRPSVSFGGFGLMKGGVHSVLKQTYWQELRDSHLTPPWFCPNNRVHLRFDVSVDSFDLQVAISRLPNLDGCPANV